jgi:hypothetical protein
MATKSPVENVNATSPSMLAGEISQPEKLGPREIRLCGQCIVDTRQFQAGDLLYVFSSLQCEPLVAELKLAGSQMSFSDLSTLARQSADK